MCLKNDADTLKKQQRNKHFYKQNVVSTLLL
ncbi:hypothetical protein CLU83_1389 [Flavobacterium sp. 1]|nr:hypothetical protein CLU83_1389 [Flavobacterium sp. 1]